MLGIIHLNAKLIYGLNNKKNPYYKVEPFRNNEKNYLVAINDKKLINSNKKYYVLFKPNAESEEERMPKSKLIKIIGEVGQKNAELEKFLYYHKINQTKHNFKHKQTKNIYDIIDKEEISNYKDLTDLYTVAIDPPGCKDIDDAMSYEYTNCHNVYVHISDVSFWVKKYKLEEYINKQKFTFYSYNKNYNIFPKFFSENLFSLCYNQERLAFTLHMKFDENYTLISSEFLLSIVKVNKTMTYKKAENIVNQNDNLKMLFDISKTLFPTDGDFDFHNVIENYMVMTNKLSAEFLIKHSQDVILRKHSIKTRETPTFENQQLKTFMKFYFMESAVYDKYTEGNDYYHNGLDLEYYCHFTSPIRRVVDIDTHLKMKKILHNDTFEINLDCEKINEENKRFKKAYRDFEKINKLFNAKLNENYTAHIIDINCSKDNRIRVYIPELGITETIKLFSEKMLGNVYEATRTDNMLEITNKETNEVSKYYQYSSINIKILKSSSDFIFNITN